MKYSKVYGIDSSHLTDGDNQKPLKSHDVQPADVERLRYAAEHIAIAWYTMRGFEVMSHVIPGAADLVAHYPNDRETFRVQVKSTSGSSFSLTRNVGVFKDSSELYSSNDVDEFFLVNKDARMFRIPIAAVEGQRTLSVRRCALNEVYFTK
jgi:hypothetical protein